MKKFNEILNENNKGVLDNEVAVELIVKDYEFIKQKLFKYLESEMDKVNTVKVYNFMDDSFKSTVIQDNAGDYYLKYFSIKFAISDEELVLYQLDIAEYLVGLKKQLMKSFTLKDNAIFRDTDYNFYNIKIDYDAFLQSDLYRSMKGIDKYNL